MDRCSELFSNSTNSRWSEYGTTIHGGNEVFKQLFEQNSEAHFQMQYTLLKVLPKEMAAIEVVQVENLYKRKLNTIQFYYNHN